MHTFLTPPGYRFRYARASTCVLLLLAALLASIAFVLVVPQFNRLERGFTEFLAALALTDSPAHQKETWDQLTQRQCEAARQLGYDSSSWNDGDAPAEIWDASWNELTHQQRNAARILDYTEQSWNVEKDKDVAEREAQASVQISDELRAELDRQLTFSKILIAAQEKFDTA